MLGYVNFYLVFTIRKIVLISSITCETVENEEYIITARCSRRIFRTLRCVDW